MRLFIPELSQIRPQWIEAWGEEFGVAGLANAMAANKRLSKRVHQDILNSMDIDLSARFTEEEVLTVAQYVDDPDRMARLCGLVLNSEVLRSKVSKSDFDALSRLFNADDLKIAVSLGREYSVSAQFEADADRLADLVKGNGQSCIASWKSGLSDQMAKRLMLMESENMADNDHPPKPGPDQATKIINAVTQSLNEPEFQTAA